MQASTPATVIESAPTSRNGSDRVPAGAPRLSLHPARHAAVRRLDPLPADRLLSHELREWNLIKPSSSSASTTTRALPDASSGRAGQHALLCAGHRARPDDSGLGIALLLDGPLRARGFFRTIYYIPVVTSWVVVSLFFTYLYNGQAGLINWVLPRRPARR